MVHCLLYVLLLATLVQSSPVSVCPAGQNSAVGVDRFDPALFSGTWYEIATSTVPADTLVNPHCYCSEHTYNMTEQGMSLEQRCRPGSFRAALTVTLGAHTMTQSSPAGTWDIALTNPVTSEPNHVVVWLNGEGTQPYSSALVTSQCMDRLSIIARDRELHPLTVGSLMDKAMTIGIDI